MFYHTLKFERIKLRNFNISCQKKQSFTPFVKDIGYHSFIKPCTLESNITFNRNVHSYYGAKLL
jgi:hypothetical protein